jgi:site-specific DNA-methyltransferase (adenine-specific)
LDDALAGASRSITETKSETIIDRKTWNWLIGLHTSATTTLCSETLKNGSPWPAVTVAESLAGGGRSKNVIPIVTALGPVTWNAVARFEGFNLALKPAVEPICVARKPPVGTVAANVLRFGTGALNIDGCRVAHAGEADLATSLSKNPGRDDLVTSDVYGAGRPQQRVNVEGRWPANLVHDGSDEVLYLFPETKTNANTAGAASYDGTSATTFGKWPPRPAKGQQSDSGSAARFFYCAKASTAERGEGNTHATVKPIALMRWLVRLVTPPGGTVLDPFAGSGTTGLAAMAEGFAATLIEADAGYADIIASRITRAKATPVQETMDL